MEVTREHHGLVRGDRVGCSGPFAGRRLALLPASALAQHAPQGATHMAALILAFLVIWLMGSVLVCWCCIAWGQHREEKRNDGHL